MTREELEKELSELESKRTELRKQLKQYESGDTDDDVVTMASLTKKALQSALMTGNLKSFLETLTGHVDFAKSALVSFTQIVEKAQEKIEGKVEEVKIASGMSVMSNTWLPMIMGIMQTQEFQHLMANMLVKVLNES